jgi:hypothetical protein
MILIPLLALTLLGQSGTVNSQIPAEIRPAMPGPNQTVATVNGVAVTAGDIEPMLWQVSRRSLEHDFVDYLIVKGAADAAKVVVSDTEVNARMTKFLDQMRATLTPGQTLESMLQAKEFSDARLFLRVKTQVLLEKIQLQSFHPKDWVKVSTMIFETPGKKPDVMKAAAYKATQFYGKLTNGGSWDQLFAQVTTDPNALKGKGALGWHSLDVFPQSARDQLTQLKLGGITRPVETANAIQIFRLDGIGAEASGSELEALKQSYLASTIGTTIKAIRAKAKVVFTKGE